MPMAPNTGWGEWSPEERAEVIRRHALRLPDEAVMALFNLSREGLRAIIGGYTWKPHYTDRVRAETNTP